MIIIKKLSKTIKGYQRDYQEVPPNLDETCPLCGHKLHKHGSYARNVVTKTESYILRIYRWKCSSRDCKQTFSVLPDFLLPYRVHYSLIYESFFINIFLSNDSYQQTNNKISQGFYGRIPQTTLKRWKKLCLKYIDHLPGKLLRILLQLTPLIEVSNSIRAPNQAGVLLELIQTIWKKIHTSSPYPYYGLLSWINLLEQPQVL